jgi:hypothetical protein
MKIKLFENLIVENALVNLEVEGQKYQGLYVDMNDKDSRKYIKDQAILISNLIKKIETKRIKEIKRYRITVDLEAKSIITRLKIANQPYDLLIDAHKAERAKILADEKLVVKLRMEMIEKENDHEMALLINKTFEYDKAQEQQQKIENEKQIIEEAERKAIARHSASMEQSRQDDINAKNARLANKKHIQMVKTEIYKVLIQFELSDKDAKTVIHLATINELPNLTINY